MGEGAKRVTVIGGDRGRLSHLITNAAVVASDRWAGTRITWLTAQATVEVLHGGGTAAIHGAAGDLVTLVPVHGPCEGVTTSGLRWALSGATIAAGTSLGLSNEMTDDTAAVDLQAGTLLVIHERQEP